MSSSSPLNLVSPVHFHVLRKVRTKGTRIDWSPTEFPLLPLIPRNPHSPSKQPTNLLGHWPGRPAAVVVLFVQGGEGEDPDSGGRTVNVAAFDRFSEKTPPAPTNGRGQVALHFLLSFPVIVLQLQCNPWNEDTRSGMIGGHTSRFLLVRRRISSHTPKLCRVILDSCARERFCTDAVRRWRASSLRGGNPQRDSQRRRRPGTQN